MLRNSLFPGIVEKRLMQVADILPEKLFICEKEKMGKLCHTGWPNSKWIF